MISPKRAGELVDVPLLSVCDLRQARAFSLSEGLLSPKQELLTLSEIYSKVV